MKSIEKRPSSDNYLIPPSDVTFGGGGGNDEKKFIKLGELSLEQYIKYGKLKPDAKVLDVGCGVGCKALALTKYLSDQGEYHGFDLVKERIEWCQKAYQEKHPNFNFQVLDVYSRQYNQEGKFSAAEYKFPYEDNEFDFVMLNSVFTHMLYPDVVNYLSEIARVLKPGGISYISYFLLNNESLSFINFTQGTFGLGQGTFERLKGKYPFKFQVEHGLTVDNNTPEKAIGFYENVILDQYKKLNLEINEPILYGAWCGRKNYITAQDTIVATKRQNTNSNVVNTEKSINLNSGSFIVRTEDNDSYFKIEIDDKTFLFNSEVPQIKGWIRNKCSNNRVHEPILSKLVFDYLTEKPESVFFDIGAYLGYFSIFGLGLSKKTKVVAFEMNPRSCNLIRENILCNKHLNLNNIKVENVALSDALSSDKNYTIQGFRLIEKGGATKEPEFDFTTLDEYCRVNNTYPNLIKIDVEGWEAKIIKGAEKLLSEQKPTLYVELHSNQLLQKHGMTRIEFIEYIMGFGYSCFYAGKHRESDDYSTLPHLDSLEKLPSLTQNINDEADDVYVFRA